MSSFDEIYLRMLTIPCGTRPDWEAAQAELEKYMADDEEGGGIEADAVTRLRRVLEHPDESGLWAFVHRNTLCYLAVGTEYNPTEALEVLWAFDEVEDIIEAAGLEVVTTGLCNVDWASPETVTGSGSD